MSELRGKRALVMGLGVHGGGLGVTRFLVEQGADVTVTDLRCTEQLAPTLAQLADLPVRYVLGEHRAEDFRNTDLVIRNPGVPRESRYLEIARAAGAAIEMEMTLFFRLCPGPIIGITGTKGKTTTTLLTGAMLRQQFPDTVIAGNLRVSALEQLPQIRPQTPVVLELSSWQLEGLGEARLSPQYACYLNLYPDHLDRYGSMEAYGEAKEHIFLHQRPGDVAVFNSRGSAYSFVYGGETRGWRFWDTPARKFWFLGPPGDDDGFNPGQHFTDDDRFIGWDDTTLVWQQPPADDDEPGVWIDERLCELADVQLVGDHNLANVAAAAALAKAFGIENEHIRAAIRSFSGVADRMELVREVGGVRYINDTTATTPVAAQAALDSLQAPTIVIVGGADKRLEFAGLAHTLLVRAKAIVLLDGSATPKLLAAINQARAASGLTAEPAIVGPFDAFQPAVLAAHELTAPGDVVLLSPGCASFGMFKNEFDRGAQFRQIVQALS